jgi:hypothetical protein
MTNQVDSSRPQTARINSWQDIPDLQYAERRFTAAVSRVKLSQGNADTIQNPGELVSGGPGIIDHHRIAGRRIGDVAPVP